MADRLPSWETPSAQSASAFLCCTAGTGDAQPNSGASTTGPFYRRLAIRPFFQKVSPMPITRALTALVALCLTIFAQNATAQAQPGNYVIRPGDTLRIEVLEDETLNRSLLVLPDGRISMPMAGNIMAAGRSVGQVQRNITSALVSSFALQPTVFVSVSALSEQGIEPLTVYVLGEAANPGRVEIEPGTTVLQLFAQVGGFSSFAALKRIQLRRTDPATGTETIYGLNYKDIQNGRSSNGLVRLQEGDVIMVPQRRLFE